VKARAWRGLAFLIVLMGSVLFVTAGTLGYWQAWAYLAIYATASELITARLMKSDPALLERRLRGGPTAEKEPVQKAIMVVASIGFVSSLIVPALDHRFGWSQVPYGVVAAGLFLVALSFAIIWAVFQANTFTASTVEIFEGQSVVSTGPYAIVRHPMYAGGALLFVGTPLALGSFWGILAFFVVLPALIWRLIDEERLLTRQLPGYAGYCTKVRWRLIPHVF
jgi:protein-S-isoprenylcysteine O-methyltransferase Ste14